MRCSLRRSRVARAVSIGLALALCLFAAPAVAQVTLTSPLNVNALTDAGQASVSATAFDIGNPRDVFDGSTATLYRSANINPCQITVAFTSPQTLASFRAMAAAATTRYRVETADTAADLSAHTGTYFLMVDWVSAANEIWVPLNPAAPRSARIVRLTAQRMAGDNYVHIREWEISASLTVTSLTVDPTSANVLAGQTRQFHAIGHTSGGGTTDVTTQATWSCAPGAIAATTVTPGRISGLAAGNATVTATLSSLSGNAALHVIDDPTDLNVTYISRTPRYNYDATTNNPSVGQTVTYTAHARTWGSTVPASAGYEWRYDGQVVASGTLSGFTSGGEVTSTYARTWQSGNHTIAFTIDPQNAVTESTELNNTRTDRTNAVLAGFWVEQGTYDYFHLHQRELGAAVGSNSWEDWIQRQMDRHNQLCATAIWPVSPSGVLDRVRIDEIIIVPDGSLPLAGGLATNNPDLRDKTIDLMWGFPSGQIDGSFYANTTGVSDGNPFYFEQSLLHELGHARYLIDEYGFDVHNTAAHGGYDQVQILENGSPVGGSVLMPFVAWDEVLHYNASGGLMSGPYGLAYSPHEAGALNLIAGRRAQCGNYNAPCNIGVYLNDLPTRNHVRFLDTAGCPIANAQVRVYQAAAGQGLYGKLFDNTPDLTFNTDASGEALFPRNPFSNTGDVTHWNPVNGVAILRVAASASPTRPSFVSYRFLEVADFNLQYWMGNTADGQYSITVPEAHGCRANFDCSSLLEVQDIFTFLNAWFAADPRANFNGGALSVQDIFDFLNAWFAGC